MTNPCGRKYGTRTYLNSTITGSGCWVIPPFTNKDYYNSICETRLTTPVERATGLKFEGFGDTINHITNDACILTADPYCVQTGWDSVNKFNCCIGNRMSAKDCSSKWCPGSSECGQDEDVINFCTSDNGQNIKNPVCQNICNQNSDNKNTVPSIQTWCDSASEKFCAQDQNDDDPYCGCINSGKNEISPLVLCAYTPCGSLSYKTAQLQKNIDLCTTGTKTICTAIFECEKTNNCTIENIDLQQKCGNDTGTGSDTGNGNGNDTDNIDTTINYTIYIIIGIIIIVLIIIIVFVIYYYNKKT